MTPSPELSVPYKVTVTDWNKRALTEFESMGSIDAVRQKLMLKLAQGGDLDAAHGYTVSRNNRLIEFGSARTKNLCKLSGKGIVSFKAGQHWVILEPVSCHDL